MHFFLACCLFLNKAECCKPDSAMLMPATRTFFMVVMPN
uniref:Uncharacterized protein n=1 Tax=Rhizophora mucronata TaxID=61149 RepID=A0A2P2PDX4_RHIMU